MSALAILLKSKANELRRSDRFRRDTVDEWLSSIEEVNQVRRYRNWVAHGRRAEPAEYVTPPAAYRRLRAFLAALFPMPSLAP